MMKKIIILALLTIFIAFSPLFFSFNLHKTKESFMGADSIAEIRITEIDKGYEPWFKPIFEPPSSEVESFLFSLQSAIGGIVLGYIFGYYRKKEN